MPYYVSNSKATGRPCKDKRNYWSDQHRYLLYNLAEKTLKIHPNNNMSIDELVSWGWESCLRRRKADQLKGCSKFVLSNMRRQIEKSYKEYKQIRKYTDYYYNDPFTRKESSETVEVLEEQTEAEYNLKRILNCKIKVEDRKILKWYLNGVTFREIAIKLGVSKCTATKRVKDIIKDLKSQVFEGSST